MNGIIPKELDDILHWRHRPYSSRNSRSWLSEDLGRIYDNTSGPHQSPDPVECFILYSLAMGVPGNVLEIGSWKGRSACFLAHGIKKSKNPGRHLHCVDWFNGDSTGGAGPDMKTMRQTMEFLGLTENVHIHNQDMMSFNYGGLKNIDLVFYDSDHNTDPTTEVLLKMHKHINENALVCIHDSLWDMTKNAILNVRHLYRELITFHVWEGFSIIKKIKRRCLLQ